MLKIFKIVTPLLAFALVLSLTACRRNNVVSNTQLKFDHSADQPANYRSVETIYINEPIDELVMNARLKINSGSASVKVIDSKTNVVVWGGKYNQGTNFKIKLPNLKAQSEYLVEVNAVQTKKMKLTLTSNEKLVKNKERPRK